jgi:SAM-dependent methyltransferase/methyltransferase-like protein
VTTPTIYDLVPYDCGPIAFTAPEHVALTSVLAGGPAPPLEGFRLLELGCGDGSNLLALAHHRPGATFVGLDASRVQIEMAERAARELGIDNVRFFAADVRSPGDIGGAFDFIVCHGVFSWVPEGARRAILEHCAERLTPGGLAYISYNIFPGWKLRGMVREELLHAVRDVTDPRERAPRAVQAVAQLRAAIPRSDHPYSALLAAELDMVLESSLPYVLHEYLSEVNDACYYRDFVALAREHGLEPAGDAISRAVLPDAKGDAAGSEQAPAGEIEREQTMDLLHHRQFRATVLCRRGAPRRRAPGQEIVRDLRVAASLTPPSGPPRLDPGVVELFDSGGKSEVRINGPLSKAALRVLREVWPLSMPLSDLVARATALLRDHGIVDALRAEDVATLERDLFLMHRFGQVELRLVERIRPSSAAALRAGARPALDRFARHEIARRSALTSANHQIFRLDRVELAIARALDGARDEETLAAMLVERIAAGDPPLEIGGARVTGREVLEPLVRALLARSVENLARWGFLAGAGP